jgi:hypothetical protein
VDFLWRTDPLADAVMDEFARIPESEWRALLELALAKGIEAVPHAPEPLRALFRQLESVPFWVDRERCNLGGATFMRCRLGFAVLAMLSLPIIYSWHALRFRRLPAGWSFPFLRRLRHDRARAPHSRPGAAVASPVRPMALRRLGRAH